MIFNKLNSEKIYKVHGKSIEWTLDKTILQFKVALDWQNYKDSDLQLPEKCFGRCDWNIKKTDKIVTFTARWDIRRIKNHPDLVEYITKRVSKYACPD
jgi:hypothetical protein